MQTTDTTHDPSPPEPSKPLGDDDVLIPRAAAEPRTVAALIAHRSHLTASPMYRLVAAGLSARFGPTEPMDLVKAMADGRYRWRHRDGAFVTDSDGERCPDHMSFRAIATELERLTGETVTYETLRRWWGRVWPGTSIPDAPARQAAAEAGDRLRSNRRAYGPEVVPPVTFLPPQ